MGTSVTTQSLTNCELPRPILNNGGIPMNSSQELQTRSAFVLTFCALLLSAGAAQAADHRGEFTEELHRTYPLTQNGRVELDNINGAVHISTWDRNEVKLD